MATDGARRTRRRFLTGWRKAVLYGRIAAHVAGRYALCPDRFAWRPWRYARFLIRAGRLLLAFRHDKPARVPGGWKLQLYLPAYPSAAFFTAIETKLLRTPPGPVTVVLSMTKACSYRCEHCYQSLDGGPDLDEAELLETARAVQESGVALFDIEGGEPLARFPRLLALLRAIDSRSEVWANTTGAGLTEERLAAMREAGLCGLMVSIHSTEASVHDAFCRVDGAFEAACEAVRLCRRMGLAAAANCVLSEDEIREGAIPRFMDFARDLGCDFVQLIHPKPAGMWLGRTEGMQRDEALLDLVRREHLRANGAACPEHPSLAAQAFEESAHILGCTAGAVDRFYVNATGEVQPCEFLNLSFGTVREEPFEAILERMRAAFPEPRTGWLCCTQAGEIQRLMVENGLTRTPLPRDLTERLVAGWDRGEPTPLYERLGIYR
jgi:MoaA/NifB/PqqE/SkfB family radical SAM enzyme